jgi:hypothetical protein
MASEDRKAFLLRIDPVLWSELEAWAGDELRSVNGQVEFLLRQAVQRRKKALAAESEGAGDEGTSRNAG